ncbi:MAG: hypothetical protein R3323_06350 [Wenzhouxiangellaceae bacterium]|nr:hypothetical protein [Wenzhouxiangellaceae bacterium]
MNRIFPLLLSIAFLAACGPSDDASEATPADDAAVESTAEKAPEPMPAPEPPERMADEEASAAEDDRLGSILAAQPEAIRARYDQRHPRETLEFFGIEPGMTVVEALPGGGWYSRILIPYLGEEGRLVGANYALDMYPNFPFADDEFMTEMRQWPTTFPTMAEEWCETDCAEVETFWMGELPEDMEGAADAVLFVRVLHNLARFQNENVGPYLDLALADAHAVLKPGGTFGVVQHSIPDSAPDDWARGDRGYLKPSWVVSRVEDAGFELVARSDVNANPADQPGDGDIVWRLPPSLATSEEGSDERAEYEAIGESNRMTLKFRKVERDPMQD